MATTTTPLLDGARIKAGCGHPIRVRILALYATRRTPQTLSPVEMSRLLNEPLGVVSYHVRMLVTAGLLALSGTKQRRGALEHHYRLDGRSLALLRDAMEAQVRALENIIDHIDNGEVK
jgi:hypothetical protein